MGYFVKSRTSGREPTGVVIPGGLENERPQTPQEGMTRYNNELKSLEFWNGSSWRIVGIQGTVTVESLLDSWVGDGVENEFTIQQSTSNPYQVMVFVGGIYQVPVTSFTVSGNTLTTSEPVPMGVPINIIHNISTDDQNTPPISNITVESIVSTSLGTDLVHTVTMSGVSSIPETHSIVMTNTTTGFPVNIANVTFSDGVTYNASSNNITVPPGVITFTISQVTTDTIVITIENVTAEPILIGFDTSGYDIFNYDTLTNTVPTIPNGFDTALYDVHNFDTFTDGVTPEIIYNGFDTALYDVHNFGELTDSPVSTICVPVEDQIGGTYPVSTPNSYVLTSSGVFYPEELNPETCTPLIGGTF